MFGMAPRRARAKAGGVYHCGTIRRRMKLREKRVSLDGSRMTLEDVERIADGASCTLAASAVRRMRASRSVVTSALRSGRKVYGINTGFGQLAQVGIDPGHLAELQENLVRSHSAGVGAPLPERVVRAVLALR